MNRNSRFPVSCIYNSMRRLTSMSQRVFRAMLAVFVMSSSLMSIRAQSPTPDPNTGIEGVITMSPIRPGPIREGEPDSKPIPNTAFAVTNQDGPVSSFTTDAEGKFKISLPPGHYKVSKQGGGRIGMGRSGPFEVDVVAGKMTQVKWDF